jgi:hypothetical protein
MYDTYMYMYMYMYKVCVCMCAHTHTRAHTLYDLYNSGDTDRSRPPVCLLLATGGSTHERMHARERL